jgi:hypothetical protein
MRSHVNVSYPIVWSVFALIAGPGLARGVAADAPTISEPHPYQVFQRDRNDRATIPVVVVPGDGAKVSSVTLHPLGMHLEDNAFVGVPTGGPYTVSALIEKEGGAQTTVQAGPFFVGDLWVLAGQSNMEGVGDLLDVIPPHDRVMLLGMGGQWSRAEEPLHWLVDSPDPVHSGDPSSRAERAAGAHKTRMKGAGLGLPFAVSMVKATNVPVGLVACAHGGTSMEQWNPSKKDEAGNSLYGSMLRQVKLAGGKVKGVLWYQGESDANEKAATVYPKVFAEFIGAVRKELGQPELPFYFVQIGRFIHQEDPKSWNAVQDAERRTAERVPSTAVVAVIDLELDDLIHVGTPGLKRTGQRLARVALHELFGRAGGTTPTFDRVAPGPNNTLVVTFKGVNTADPLASSAVVPAASRYGLRPERHIAGFSLRKVDGTEIPLIFDAAVGPARETVILKLTGKIPPGANLWYGWGYDPYCNLADGTDMAVPVFGPIPLDEPE